MNLWKTSILFKLISSFLGLSLITLSLVGYAAFNEAKKSLQESIFEKLNTTANLKEEELSRWLNSQADTLLSLVNFNSIKNPANLLINLSSFPDSKQNNRKFLEKNLKDFISNQPYIEEIFLVNRSSKILSSTNIAQLDKYQPLIQYTEVTSKNKNNLNYNFYRAPDTEKPRVTLVTPILDSHGKNIGFLGLHLNLDRIDKIIRDNQGFGKTNESYLVGDLGSSLYSNRVLISTSENNLDLNLVNYQVDSLAITQAMSSHNNGQGLYNNYNGIPVIGVYRWLDSQDLALLVEIQQEEAFAPAKNLAVSILLIGIISAIFLALIMLFLGLQITQPILEITEVAYSISDGVKEKNFSSLPTALIASENEIGVLANAFNQMIQELQIAYAQLENYSHTLELKVADRTTELIVQNELLEDTLLELKRTQSQLVQNEKMISLGQLVAGVAHEINNPINFIQANISYLSEYSQELLEIIYLWEKETIATSNIVEKMDQSELEYIKKDLPKIISSMQTGTTRIVEIVRGLKNFSRLDRAEKQRVDIHEGLENTILILASRFREINLIKNYGQLPPINCYPGELNQVFMNIICNAIYAVENKKKLDSIFQPTISIKTELIANSAWIYIQDNGTGMDGETQSKIFDPFFTTKPVGQGTGLGLAISYSIVVKQHQGELICQSNLGEGTEFIVKIPNIGYLTEA